MARGWPTDAVNSYDEFALERMLQPAAAAAAAVPETYPSVGVVDVATYCLHSYVLLAQLVSRGKIASLSHSLRHRLVWRPA